MAVDDPVTVTSFSGLWLTHQSVKCPCRESNPKNVIYLRRYAEDRFLKT
jgi:hypothetical protein